ncbi:MAG: replication-associated recombination protein A [Candidatus Omnitrophica bacterium]|nr:replication-associated recombination protein A [Candidatus Omnitrophota bacterium]
MDLFSEERPEDPKKSLSEPLAARMRPTRLAEFAGQTHLLGPGKILTRAIESDKISSLVFYGPPGTGKTTLAAVISHETKAHFEPLNAVTSNVAEIRKAIADAKRRWKLKHQKTILFIDEIHRFNKAQQDVLMPDVERGNPVLIGATTHNPFFSIVSPLLSRSLIFELKPLGGKEIELILKRAIEDKTSGFGNVSVQIAADAMAFLCKVSDGDARRALNALERGVLTTPATEGTVHLTREVVEECIQKKAVVYDADEDAHYDTISAFIKSMRGSDPDAALYYLAKMLYAGEDTRFIARRIVICAAEDVGNADPQALVLANAALQVSEFIGMPEARIPLAQAAVYIACSPKSNAAYLGIENAMKDIAENKTLEVPSHLKDAGYKGAKSLGHGEGYKYAHDFQGHHVEQEYLTEKRSYYTPTEQGFEKNFKEYLEKIRGAPRK